MRSFVKTIFFDMDGTLLKKHPLDMAMKETNKKIAKLSGVGENDINSMIRKTMRQLATKDNYIGWDWDGATKIVAGSLKVDVEINLVKSMQKYLKRPYIELYPDAKTVLKQLYNSGYELNIATHGFYCYQEPILRTLGLTKYFKSIVTPDAKKTIKTDPAFLNVVNNKNKNVVMVGDSYYFDVYSPKRHGIKAVWSVFWLGSPEAKKIGRIDPSDRAKYIQGNSEHDDSQNAKERLESYKSEFLPDATILNLAELPPIISKLI